MDTDKTVGAGLPTPRLTGAIANREVYRNVQVFSGMTRPVGLGENGSNFREEDAGDAAESQDIMGSRSWNIAVRRDLSWRT